jgi:hypothetical protein
MIRVEAGKRHPNIIAKTFFRLRFLARRRMTVTVEVRDGDRRYRFQCENLREYSHCVKMFVKEPGTCRWIKEAVKPGQVFYDIGANIGVYTVMAVPNWGHGQGIRF